MRVLHEAMPPIDNDLINKWNKGSKQERVKILDDILIPGFKNPGSKGLEPVRGALFNIFATKGIDPKTNDFVKLISKLPWGPNASCDEKLRRLSALQDRENVDLSLDYLLNPTLWGRNLDDFTYTVRIFDAIHNPSKLNKYFKDTSDIRESDLYEDDGKTIKEVGFGKDDWNYLYTVVESWSGENGSNEVKDNEEEEEVKGNKNNYTVRESLEHYKINTRNDKAVKESCEVLVNKYWNDIDDFYKPKFQKESYLNQLNGMFSNTSKSYINNLKKNDKGYTSIVDQVKANPALESPGTILVANMYDANDVGANKDIDADMIDRLWIYDNGEWRRLKETELQTELKNIEAINKENIQKLLDTKSVYNYTSKPSIAAGIVSNLDTIINGAGEEDEVDPKSIF